MKACRKIFFFLFLLFTTAFHIEAQVSEDVLRADVEFLSDTLCAGRAAGTRGNVEAAGYILRRLSALGYEARVQSFQIDSDRVGHNILAGAPANGVLNVTNYKSASKVKPLIVLLAYYDGLGILSGRMYPCADSNASGVAALLSIAERVKGREDVLMVFLDGHNANLSGAAALRKALKGRRIALVANIDIIGSTLAPVDKYWPDFLIALGAERHRLLLEECNKGLQLHYYHTYYRSRTFSDLFYRRAGDHKDFLADGHHSILFTSGITDNTNKPSDTFDTLDYEVFAKRVEFISRFIENYGRSYY
ncbi:MAG: M28 family peptidase [Candidatus Cryptobacteroides sp.]|jgi:Zn-dependent M28 family amino/carboxypeptidase